MSETSDSLDVWTDEKSPTFLMGSSAQAEDEDVRGAKALCKQGLSSIG